MLQNCLKTSFLGSPPWSMFRCLFLSLFPSMSRSHPVFHAPFMDQALPHEASALAPLRPCPRENLATLTWVLASIHLQVPGAGQKDKVSITKGFPVTP